jgi:uncharacterized membrane protein YjgN (DUF898 family)
MELVSPLSSDLSGRHISHRLRYDGKLGTLFRQYLVGIVLTFLTLGIYRFWYKTHLRRYIASSFSLDGQRFEYTGKASELFRGFLVAAGILLLVSFGISFAGEKSILNDILTVAFIYLFFVGQYAAMRYRLSRTVWRGIRCRLRGSAFKYGLLVMGSILGKGLNPWIAGSASGYDALALQDRPCVLWRASPDI